MQDKVIGTDRESTLDFSAKSFDGLLKEKLIGAGKIDQIVCVNDEGLEVILGAQAKHLIAQRMAQFIRSPLARARRKNLKRAAAQPIGAFGCVLNSTSRRGVDADAAGSSSRRLFRRGAVEDVLFPGLGAGHMESIKCRRLVLETTSQRSLPFSIGELRDSFGLPAFLLSEPGDAERDAAFAVQRWQR